MTTFLIGIPGGVTFLLFALLIIGALTAVWVEFGYAYGLSMALIVTV